MLDCYTFKHFNHDTNISHLISTKSTTYPYAFSQALHTGEKVEAIISNRELLAKQFPSTNTLHFIVANQTHSDTIHRVTTAQSCGWKTQKDAIANCDALITNLSNVVLTILTADCVPILLYDKKNHVIAIVHAGWKGTQKRIVQKTIQKMQTHFNCDVNHILVGIGPAIKACCYEVKDDVAQHFLDHTKPDHRYMIDLPNINQKQILDCGVPVANIENSDICTSCQVERFFSYRKEKGCTGRFISMIRLIS